MIAFKRHHNPAMGYYESVFRDGKMIGRLRAVPLRGWIFVPKDSSINKVLDYGAIPMDKAELREAVRRQHDKEPEDKPVGNEELRIHYKPLTAASGMRHVACRVFADYLIDHDLRFAYQPHGGGAGAFTVLDNAAGRRAAEIMLAINPEGTVRIVES